MKPTLAAAALAIAAAVAGCGRAPPQCPCGQEFIADEDACYWTCGSTYCYVTPGAHGQSPCWCADAGTAPVDAGLAEIPDAGAPDAIWLSTPPPRGTPDIVLLPEGDPIFHIERSGVLVFDVDAGVAGAAFARGFNAILGQGGCRLVCGGVP